METTAVTADAEAAQPPKAPSALERRLDLSLLAVDLDKEIEQRVRHIGKTMKMPGFRPGKVPTSLIRQHYGEQARYEALNESLDKAFNEAVKAQSLRVAGQPKIEARHPGDEKSLEFTAVFEVYPEIQLGKLQDVEIERSVLEVGEAELNSTLEVLRKQRVRYEPVERAAEQGDRATIDFLGKKGGEPFQGGEAKDYPVVLGEGALLPDFEKAVLGMKAGEGKSFELTFPADYFSKELAGQAVSFEVSVKKLEQAILPEIDADFAKALGIADGNTDKMRDEIASNLKREVKKRLQARTKDKVMEALLQINPIEVPNALVEREIDRLQHDAREDMAQRTGQKMTNFPLQREWFVERAKRRVSLGLILAEVVKAHALQAKPAQIREIVNEMAQSYENPQEVVRWYYAQPQRLAEIEGVAIEDNVVDWALANAKTVDHAVAFDELMGQKR